jgi:hypothetical protein
MYFDEPIMNALTVIISIKKFIIYKFFLFYITLIPTY